jgi:3-deoxy-D-manno-octulosonate 8-phosphate phosphatase (KDO 8-P phosphatase)
MTELSLPNTIKMVITDFDGIVTDNCVYISDDGILSRKINFKDVVGFYNLKKNGINAAIISGEKNSAIETIAKNLEIKEVYQNIREKLPVLKNILEKYNLSQEEYLYIGDEINDLECLNYAKYRLTVPNAVDKVKAVENIQITQNSGGMGAFREVTDCLIN